MRSRNSAAGLAMFFVYLALYGGFVGLNAFRPQLMELTPVAGLNVAILYGFGLILGALALSLIYGVVCARRPPESSPEQESHP